jgi:hypothetical protein
MWFRSSSKTSAFIPSRNIIYHTATKNKTAFFFTCLEGENKRLEAEILKLQVPSNIYLLLLLLLLFYFIYYLLFLSKFCLSRNYV